MRQFSSMGIYKPSANIKAIHEEDDDVLSH
jgi:hypothetical protein